MLAIHFEEGQGPLLCVIGCLSLIAKNKNKNKFNNFVIFKQLFCMFCLYPPPVFTSKILSLSVAEPEPLSLSVAEPEPQGFWFHNCSFFYNELFLDFVAKLLIRNSRGKKFMVLFISYITIELL
jgi:hypothetical protein